MHFLDELPFIPFETFSMSIGEIDAGWMYITLSTKEKQFQYIVSYVCDPINDLLNATVRLIMNQPFKIRGDYYWENCAFVAHDMENDMVIWFLEIKEGFIRVAIWNNYLEDELELLAEYGFDKEICEREEWEKLPDLQFKLIAAFECPAIDFAEMIKQLLDELATRIPDPEKAIKDNWGYQFSEENYALLNNWLI